MKISIKLLLYILLLGKGVWGSDLYSQSPSLLPNSVYVGENHVQYVDISDRLPFSYWRLDDNNARDKFKQDFIDSGYNGCAGTSFNPYDNELSWIYGHNPGSMTPIANLTLNKTITVTDTTGKVYNYKVVSVFDENLGQEERSFDLYKGNSPNDLWNEGLGEEAVVIQYCVNDKITVYFCLPEF